MIRPISAVSVTIGTFAGGAAVGQGYPALEAALACRVLRHPDDIISGEDAVVSCTTDAEGRVNGYTVHAGGRYTRPPLVAPCGQWTSDGLHPSRRGNDELIVRLGFGAARFL